MHVWHQGTKLAGPQQDVGVLQYVFLAAYYNNLLPVVSSM